jgi:hypothetical protein
MTKEDIFNEVKDKYNKILEEKHLVALQIAIDKAYNEAYTLGQNQSETDKWKVIAERSTIYSDNKNKENSELLAKIKDIKDKANEFSKFLEKIK